MKHTIIFILTALMAASCLNYDYEPRTKTDIVAVRFTLETPQSGAITKAADETLQAAVDAVTTYGTTTITLTKADDPTKVFTAVSGTEVLLPVGTYTATAEINGTQHTTSPLGTVYTSPCASVNQAVEVTAEGKPVKIICTDVKRINGDSICGLMEVSGEEGVFFWQPNGDWFADVGESRYDLYFADDEPELSEFEIEIHEIIAQAQGDKRLRDGDTLAQFEKEAAAALLMKARKQFERDLPKWKIYGNGACGGGDRPIAIIKGYGNSCYPASCLTSGDEYIMLDKLLKLPKED